MQNSVRTRAKPWLFTPLLFGAALLSGASAFAQTTAGKHDAAAPRGEAARPARYRILVGFGPGGVPDVAARLIASKLSERKGVPAIVENRLGVGGSLAAQSVLSAMPDGGTLLSVSPAHATAPAIFRKLPYDTLSAFTPVTLIGTGPAVLVVSNDLKARDVSDLIRLAKEKPGSLSYSSAGVGSSSHFAVELLRLQSGIDVVNVPFKGVTEAINEVAAGRVQFHITPYTAVAQLIKEKRLRALAVTGNRRIAEMPDVPTVAESGVPGYEWKFWYGLLVSAKTPTAIVDRLNRDLVEILASPEVRGKLAQMGVNVIGSSPGDFRELLKSEVSKNAAIAKAANIKLE